MALEQDGNSVTGSYDFGGTIDGTVDGNTLEYDWYEGTYSYGTGYFVMDADGDFSDGQIMIPMAGRVGGQDMQPLLPLTRLLHHTPCL